MAMHRIRLQNLLHLRHIVAREFDIRRRNVLQNAFLLPE